MQEQLLSTNTSEELLPWILPLLWINKSRVDSKPWILIKDCFSLFNVKCSSYRRFMEEAFHKKVALQLTWRFLSICGKNFGYNMLRNSLLIKLQAKAAYNLTKKWTQLFVKDNNYNYRKSILKNTSWCGFFCHRN